MYVRCCTTVVRCDDVRRGRRAGAGRVSGACTMRAMMMRRVRTDVDRMYDDVGAMYGDVRCTVRRQYDVR